MKRKFILLPITLTALTPVIGLAGCKVGGGDKPEPVDYVVLDNFSSGTAGAGLTSTKTFFIEQNKSYYFKIDTTKWKGSPASYYSGCGISIEYDYGYASVLNNDFEILIDGEILDERFWELDDSTHNKSIWIEEGGLQQILNGIEVVGHLHTSNILCGLKDQCYFELSAELKS